MASDYEFPYLAKTMPRGQILFKIIEPYLEELDLILDANCGYAPMAKPLLDAGFEVFGFDTNEEIVEHLKQECPEGEWFVRDIHDKRILQLYFDVVLILGIDKERLVPFIQKVLGARMILLERVQGLPHFLCVKIMDEAVDYLEKHDYRIAEIGRFDAELERGSERIYCLLVKKN